MLESRVITISINRNAQALYEQFWEPVSFRQWASGLSNSTFERDGDFWKAQGPEGPIKMTFTEHNKFGVMDHWVDVGKGKTIYIPMRIIPNQDGSEVMLILFRKPEFDDKKFNADAAWVKKDLAALKALAEKT